MRRNTVIEPSPASWPWGTLDEVFEVRDLRTAAVLVVFSIRREALFHVYRCARKTKDVEHLAIVIVRRFLP